MSRDGHPTNPNEHPVTQKESVKETIISVLIAFALAFVFRSFVAEAFIIPTGSMAPTLNGAHMRFNSPDTGQDWAVGPWFHINGDNQSPYSSQSLRLASESNNAFTQIPLHDPITGRVVEDRIGRARSGDRIFVLKYLYNIQEPDPFDVVVFKNVTLPEQNYIKRLLGLPLEQIAIVDGDVFTRSTLRGGVIESTNPNPWDAPDWTIRRKPARAQKAVWQMVHDTSFVPANADASGSPLTSPYTIAGATISHDGGRWFAFDTAGGSIAWNPDAPFLTEYPLRKYYPLTATVDNTRAITDRYAYNESFAETFKRFPVGDIRLRATMKTIAGPGAPTLSATITARSHEFRANLSGDKAALLMRPEGSPESAWREVASAPLPAMGTSSRVEFWNSDQSLQLWIDDRLIVTHEYNWLPMERLKYALTDAAWKRFNDDLAKPGPGNVLADHSGYRPVGFAWTVKGPAELHAVGVDRDLHYRPDEYRVSADDRIKGPPAAATHPRSTLTLKADQFFVCGDNSPASLDGRLWGYPSPWVAEEIDPSPSVVPRKMLMGKAFFVYFPAPAGDGPVPVPDFGRLRFIR